MTRVGPSQRIAGIVFLRRPAGGMSRATLADMNAADESRTDGVQRAGDPNRAIFWAVIGTGVGLATLLLALASLFNGRIDDVNSRIDDVNASLNARIDDVNFGLNARIDDLQDDIRELRGLVIQALNESPSAD